MKFRNLPLLFLLVCSSPIVAAEAYQPPTSPAAQVKPLDQASVSRAVEMLSSPNLSVRTKAAIALRQRSLSTECKDQARGLFQQARKIHRNALETLVKRGSPALGQIKTAAAAYSAKRAEVMAMILVDYHKDPEKIAMITREHEATEKLRKSLEKELDGAAAAWKPLADATAPLAQMDREIELLDDPAASLSKTSAEAYLKDLGAAAELLQTLQIVFDSQRMVQEQAAVLKHNETCKWAPKTAIAFAAHLNAKRATMSLPPLRLDQALSEAATGHSQEMQAMGYFAHESPVTANKSPGDRASNAKFSGGWTGENIFMGSPGAIDAYNAWWGSDGHRFIMFSDAPNTLGLGPVATYWTLMTGKKNWGT